MMDEMKPNFSWNVMTSLVALEATEFYTFYAMLTANKTRVENR